MENIYKIWEFNISSIFLNHTFVKVKEIDKKNRCDVWSMYSVHTNINFTMFTQFIQNFVLEIRIDAFW